MLNNTGRILATEQLGRITAALGNVLRGDMSLVGPGPALADEVTHYDPHYVASQRARVSFRRWMAMDI
jgi:lipopolysaccharide/colanic/teichoic acid biosynthesis glycosyltransferase